MFGKYTLESNITQTVNGFITKDHFEFVKWIIQHPPKWIIFVLITILVSLTVAKILKRFTPGRSGGSKLIYNMEILLCAVLAVLTLHGFYEYYCSSRTLTECLIAFVLLIIFIVTTFVSIHYFRTAESVSTTSEKN